MRITAELKEIGLNRTLEHSLRYTPDTAELAASSVEFLVPEMPHACKNHRHSLFIRCRDNFLVAYASSRLDDCRGPCLNDYVQAHREMEKRHPMQLPNRRGRARHSEL